MATTQVHDMLHRLETTPNLLMDNWCVPRETGRFLHLMTRITGAKSICEVGTSIGYSTLWLAKAAAFQNGKVDTIEYFENRQQQAIANVNEAGLSNAVQFHLGQAIDVLKRLQAEQRQFDLVFIDAAKKEYIDYIQLLEPMMPTGACLIADNTRSHRKELEDFMAYMEAHSGFDVAEIESSNGQLLARKR